MVFLPRLRLERHPVRSNRVVGVPHRCLYLGLLSPIETTLLVFYTSWILTPPNDPLEHCDPARSLPGNRQKTYTRVQPDLVRT